MIISHSKKFIFIHVWKTGGTSVKNALKEFAADVNFDERTIKHLKARDIKKMYPIEFEQYFKFLFIRNPWDIQVSYYNYVLQNERHHDYRLISGFRDFHSFIKWRVENDIVQQHDFCFDQDDNLLVDYIGRFENLGQDFDKVMAILDIKNRTLPKLNRSVRNHYRQYYDYLSKELISKHYYKDINTFHYSF